MKFHNLFLTLSLLTTTTLVAGLSPPVRGGKQSNRLKTVAKPDSKYFHEPGSSDSLGHYDSRYFQGEAVSYDVKRDTLKYLVKSYFTVFRERNIETWIAHGSLLGWWWNGQIMPWDWDLDTQVSITTLQWLGENLNMTLHNFTYVDDAGMEVTREYLLDVNPNLKERVRGDGQNVIDARWIDVRNGLYIDITGLAEVYPKNQPGVWSCKNFHRYRTTEIWPLRETVFEGVPASVPYAFDKILRDEYTARALTKTQHEGHEWKPDLKEWVMLPQLQKPVPPVGSVGGHRRRRDLPSSASLPTS